MYVCVWDFVNLFSPRDNWFLAPGNANICMPASRFYCSKWYAGLRFKSARTTNLSSVSQSVTFININCLWTSYYNHTWRVRPHLTERLNLFGKFINSPTVFKLVLIFHSDRVECAYPQGTQCSALSSNKSFRICSNPNILITLRGFWKY